MATLVADAFTDTNGTSIEDHTPDTDNSGWGWGDLASTWDIQSNRLRNTGSVAGWGYVVIQTEQPDVDMEVDIVVPAASNVAIAMLVRLKDQDNFWKVENQTGTDTLHIYEVVGGTPTSRDSGAATMDAGNTYTLRVVTSGDTITAYWNGVEIASYASASNFNGAMVHGLASYTDGTFTSAQFEDLTVTGDVRATPSYVEWDHNDSAIGEHPIIKDGLMYVPHFSEGGTAANGGVTIYDPRDGTPLSQIKISTTFLASAPVVASNGRIYLWGWDGSIRGINRYGGVKQSSTGHNTVDWEALVLDEANQRLLVPVSGVLAARATSNINANVWSSSVALPNGIQISPPLVHGSFIYAVDTNGVLWKLNLADGTTVHSLDLSASTLNASYAQIIYDDVRDDVYVTDDDGRTVYSVDVSTSTLSLNWSVTLGTSGEEIKRGGAYFDDVLYIPVAQQPGAPDVRRTKVYALDVTDSGATLWTNTTAFDNDAHISNLLVDDLYVYGATFDYQDAGYEKLLVIARSDGSLVTSFDLLTGTASAIPVAQSGFIYVGLWNDAGVQAIQVRAAGGTGDFLWKADSDMTGYIGAFMSGSLIGFEEEYQPRAGVSSGSVFMV